MRKHKNKQEILDDLSKKEFFDESVAYSNFFLLWYDGECPPSDDYYDYYSEYFVMWLNDPQRLRDEKIDELLDLSKKNRVGDFFPKDFGDK
jgi:hypothetical protein